VTGATCIKARNNGTGTGDAMWVVGGKSNSSQPDYPGLQKYSFSDQTWETITPVAKVTQNRRNHAAVFLNQSASILVYAGSQMDKTLPSTETFLISTSSPYQVQSFISKNPPALSPLLLEWNDTAAITIGGDMRDNSIYQFSVKNGWQGYATSLQDDLKSSTQEQGTLVTGTDGSKVLEIYDMSVSPNEVKRVILQDANGVPAPAGQYIGQPIRKRRKRDLTLKNWPTYNATFAPTATRSGFSLAQDPAGLVAISGGNAQNPVALFDQERNAWDDTSQFFGLQSVVVQSASPTSTSTPAADPTNDHPRTSLVLGATLGSVLGFLALLLLLFLCLGYRRRKKRKVCLREEEAEKQRMSFADRGASFMKEAGGSVNKVGDSPHSSLAIASEPVTPRHSRGGGTAGSDSSTTYLVAPKRSLTGSNKAMEMETIREKGSDGSGRSPGQVGPFSQPAMDVNKPSGVNDFQFLKPIMASTWNRYFPGNAAVVADQPNLAMRKSGLSEESTPSTQDTSSNYAPSSHDCNTHGPTEIPPLNLGRQFTSTGVNYVITGIPSASPKTGDAVWSSKTRPRTLSSSYSQNPPSSNDDAVFTRDIHDENSQWTPGTGSDRSGPRIRDNTASSAYSHTPRNSESMDRPIFPLKTFDGHTPSSRGSNATMWPRATDMIEEPPAAYAETPQPMTSTPVTLQKPQKTIESTDLSWLNLGPLATQ